MKPFKLSDLDRLLCLCLRHCDYLKKEEIVKLYSCFTDEEVYEWAKVNGVTSIVAHSLSICLGSDLLPSRWRSDYEAVNRRISSYMEELEKVAQLLQQENIPLLALKNSGITKGMYPYYGACPMGDLDVLVSKEQFRKAHEILSANNYLLKFRCEFEEDNLDAAEQGGGAEYSVYLDNGQHLWFELQWRPVAGRWIQPHQEPNTDALIQRSVGIENSAVRLLSPEDNLLQVALHTAKHSFVRAPGFRLHTDVDRIVSTQDIDWDLFVNRVVSLRTKTAVYISLGMAKGLLGTPVPECVLDRIKPHAYKVWLMQKWIESVGVFEPDEAKWSKLGYILFVSLLFDSLSDFFSGVLPPPKEIKAHYKLTHNVLLPFYYVKRIGHLLFKREST